MAKRVNRSRRSSATAKIKFDQRLVLANWVLDLFGVATLEGLAKNMHDPAFEGFSEDGISKYHHCMRLLFDRPELSNDILLAYDENIVRHWKKITEKRTADGQTLYPKYFQYLCLLFSEIYLDRYFRNSEKLLFDINAYAKRFNAGETLQQKALGQLFATGLPKDLQVKTYSPTDLKKLAFWSATGSGKTLLMHVNILQYQHYQKIHGHESDLNRIILLTPNEGLSRQHRDEFLLSDMFADLFDKDAGGLFRGRNIEIIDIHKLRETTGEKTVAIDAFEGNNLVLVDEGHRGTSGAEVGHWMQMRNRLCEKGFSFEYSATFGQAMKASSNKELANEYVKCILFDYSYKYFYGDGYGKEYRILNLEDDSNEEHRRRYVTACLLAFYQQKKLFQDKQEVLRRFLIEKPLWIFVGGSVTKKPRKKDVSDVVDILLFLARFVKNRDESIRYLDMLLSGSSGLHDDRGRELFRGAFTYLGNLGLSGEQAFRDILATLVNAKVPGALHVKRLKAGGEAEGEIALHIGEDNEPFGLINVGDPSGLCKLCEEHPEELAVSESEFSKSLFRRVNSTESPLNVLIGSKKFSEGWSSWRVSTMGLMNIGKKEGSQIIQLFGRGVRLKGLNFCLKRSHRIVGFHAPKDIERLETLNVFGIHADYMRQFKEYLEDEGLPANEDRIEFVLPVVKNLGKKPLKIIRLKEGIEFKKQGPNPTLDKPEDLLKKSRIVVDWYPKIQALASKQGEGPLDVAVPNQAWFNSDHLAFLDIDDLYFDLQRFKSERAWYNLNLNKEKIPGLLTDSSWYVLHIPQEEMEARSFEQVRRWQEIAGTLLRKYCDRFYKALKADFEKDYLEYRTLSEDDPNFIQDYLFLINQSRQDIVTKLKEIKSLIESGELRNIEFQGFATIMFGQHLYQPLIYVNSDLIEVKPVSLNEGERDFVVDLQEFCKQNKGFFEGKELYLLRNMSRGRGIGFFEAGNFYPDFILWLLVNEKQYINFIDPKGLRNLKGPDDPKIAFYKTIKTIENDLQAQDPTITLNSFIISVTRLPEVSWWDGGMTKEKFEKCHVLFQQEEKGTYIGKMMEMAMV
ncbi:MAG: DEAD/DEAH box helicase family protein [Desulfobacteraceae bacterium]|nr:DEAD/DEAH box helicase family protein [Desulfobacteraceae bacterium]